ncbi:hypothetical protein SAMN05892883_3636 [Jatrophihabitans sp. GAS493]|uniref:pirin family protein n=1 Tax=Jatrophihabitans sp. GAS493 TaxID=1907575 RepID=UPI000BB7101E|nr:pirin family protein [Jatrophihabitans sp. GAS493]SOD74450.1 hypothetical protein SAMN05892883_3636 [Jatrophihabitans sp. GAS493]
MIRILRGEERFVSSGSGITSRHAFSAGAYFDPQRMGFGALIGHDEHHLAPGAGFDAHRHRDVEILSWVLEGVLTHADDTGRRHDVHPGQLQYQRAGVGITHSERNASDRQPLRFIQMLLRPGTPPGPPSYRLFDSVVADGSALTAGATLRVLELEDGGESVINVTSRLHLHVTVGAVELGELPLAAGDSAEIRGSSGAAVCRSMRAIGPAQALLIEF